MLRRLKNPLICTFLVGATLAASLYLSFREPISRGPSSDISQEIETDLPAVGHSNFDIVFSKKKGSAFSYDIPYPFESFIGKLESFTGKKTNSSNASGLTGSIFPMGRSLQRNAAVSGQSVHNADPYFRYPRVVIAVDGESESDSQLQINLKNKFYAGYNEKAQILEIISYNESMGRFEYQIVSDYAEGKLPKVRYANRALCLACHQNQAPIFSKAPWSESNANPAVSDELKRVLKNESYHGVAVSIDESITSRFDTSTDMANYTPVLQRIWKQLCTSDDCRSNAVLAALQFRLNRGHLFTNDTAIFNWMQSFDNDWKKLWPSGLGVPSADIPNRDPFKEVKSHQELPLLDDLKKKFSTVSELLLHSQIPSDFEPLVPRAPAEVWTTSGVDLIHGNRLTKGLSQEFTITDIQKIDAWLKQNNSNVPAGTLQAQCKIAELSQSLLIDCPASEENSFSFSALVKKDESGSSFSQFSIRSSKSAGDSSLSTTGTVSKITYEQNGIKVSLLSSEKLSLRTAQGFLISDILIDLSSGRANLQLFNQTSALRNLVNVILKPAESSGVFSRFQLIKNFVLHSHLPVSILHTERPGLPVAASDQSTDLPLDGLHPGINLIKNNCRECHQNNEAAPANFLGTFNTQLTDSEICRRVEVCAPRMIYRLKMRLCNASDIKDKKTPMPPDLFLSGHKISHQKWMTDFNPKILNFLKELTNESELARDIESSGMTQSEARNLSQDVLSDKCPDSSSIMYDRLPKCEFDEMKTATRCR